MESIEFLLKRTEQEDRQLADSLAVALGDLPLALEQAGAYIEETGISFEDYLSLFQEHRKKLLARGTTLDYPDAIASVWDISFHAVQEKSPGGVDLLNLISFLDPEGIPKALLIAGAWHQPEIPSSIADNRIEFDNAIEALKRHSLVNATEDFLSVHRLIQVVNRDRLSKEIKRRWSEAAINLVNDAFSFDPDYPQTWQSCSLLLPHALTATELAEQLEVALKATSSLLNNIAKYLKMRVELIEAKSAMERALKIDEAAYGSDHHEVAEDLISIGRVLQELGLLDEARKKFERALKIDETAYGPNHLEVAEDLIDLGRVLKDLGKLTDAKQNLEQALKIDETIYGANHPKVARDVNNLATVLQDVGQLDEAEKCFERALKIDEDVYGPSRHNVTVDLINLGRVLQDLGQLEEARKFFDRALKIDEAIYSHNHINIAWCLYNLGNILLAMKDIEGAKQFYERALLIARRVFGENHASTIMIKTNLYAFEERPDNLHDARGV